MDPALHESAGLRVAVEGCGHGTLDAIYASVTTASKTRGWDGVDLLIIGGDFQAVRNASDLTVMSCPVKYRAIGDFHAYYSGITKAPYLTIFVGGNHEASSHLWELYYGGWVAPNIYYMGAANVVRLGGIRIAGMSGIWKGYNYNKPHHERLPYNQDDVKSIYHVREIDTRKLLQLRTQVDIGISHDWPRAIENHGNATALFRMKPLFAQDSRDGTLGNLAAAYVMDRLRPPYWFAAHLHCKFAATKTYETPESQDSGSALEKGDNAENSNRPVDAIPETLIATHNADEIDLDMGDEDVPVRQIRPMNGSSTNKDEISLDDDEQESIAPPAQSSVPSNIRDQLPAAFQRPVAPQWAVSRSQAQPGQPAPPEVANKTVRFLALDKCLPGRKFLQILEVQPSPQNGNMSLPSETTRSKPKFEYDPEWLAITRVFAPDIVLGNKNARPSQDLGEDHYRAMIKKEREWVEENITKKGRLEIPENFEITAPPFYIGMPEIVNEGPKEYNNPQMQQFCDMMGIENKFFAREEEREQRMKNGPAPAEEKFGGSGRGGQVMDVVAEAVGAGVAVEELREDGDKNDGTFYFS